MGKIDTLRRGRGDDRSALAPKIPLAGAEGKEKTDQLLAAVYSLLKDLLALNSGAAELVRNTDIAAELKSLASKVDFQWLTQATQQLGQVQTGMRYNVLRSLSLDAFALSLER